jgi:hypothetical protein
MVLEWCQNCFRIMSVWCQNMVRMVSVWCQYGVRTELSRLSAAELRGGEYDYS